MPTENAIRELRLVSWNVNGLRAVMKKDPGFEQIFSELDADVFALQETKLQEGQLELDSARLLPNVELRRAQGILRHGRVLTREAPAGGAADRLRGGR